jgi:hypothetical protein
LADNRGQQPSRPFASSAPAAHIKAGKDLVEAEMRAVARTADGRTDELGPTVRKDISETANVTDADGADAELQLRSGTAKEHPPKWSARL